jgi:hypothetical protein
VGVGSRRRKRRRISEDFPLGGVSGNDVGRMGEEYKHLPVRPHMAIFSPAPMVSEMLFRARTAFSASEVDVELSHISMS